MNLRQAALSLAELTRVSTLDLLFPPRCVFCGRDMAARSGEALLCGTCRLSLSPPMAAICPRCAVPLPAQQTTIDDCPRCRGKRFRFESVTALGVYHGDLREAVLRMKQAQHEPLTLAMGRLLAGRICQRLPVLAPDVVVPVPMHWSRRLVRGINPAEVLAGAVAGTLRLPILSGLLACRRKTKKQSMLGPSERTINVRGAFRLNAGFWISDARILLVDDVMTTGATVNEVAKVCRRAGAAVVMVAVVARGIGVD